VLSQPSWHDALLATVQMPPATVWRSKDYIYMAIGVVGTTIAPWMQFYLQSSIVEKGIRVRTTPPRASTSSSAASSPTSSPGSSSSPAPPRSTSTAWAPSSASDAAEAMRPLAGDYAFILFAFGLFNASLFAASILPLSTAYTVCEGHGLRVRRGQKLQGSPFFYWLYTLLIVGGAATVLILPDAQLINFAILSQVFNGVLLPVVIILMLMLINRKDLGDKHHGHERLTFSFEGEDAILVDYEDYH
jgi:Mn2+/Fe2+ NRAMP family transporter